MLIRLETNRIAEGASKGEHEDSVALAWETWTLEMASLDVGKSGIVPVGESEIRSAVNASSAPDPSISN